MRRTIRPFWLRRRWLVHYYRDCRRKDLEQACLQENNAAYQQSLITTTLLLSSDLIVVLLLLVIVFTRSASYLLTSILLQIPVTQLSKLQDATPAVEMADTTAHDMQMLFGEGPSFGTVRESAQAVSFDDESDGGGMEMPAYPKDKGKGKARMLTPLEEVFNDPRALPGSQIREGGGLGNSDSILPAASTTTAGDGVTPSVTPPYTASAPLPKTAPPATGTVAVDNLPAVTSAIQPVPVDAIAQAVAVAMANIVPSLQPTL